MINTILKKITALVFILGVSFIPGTSSACDKLSIQRGLGTIEFDFPGSGLLATATFRESYDLDLIKSGSINMEVDVYRNGKKIPAKLTVSGITNETQISTPSFTWMCESNSLNIWLDVALFFNTPHDDEQNLNINTKVTIRVQQYKDNQDGGIFDETISFDRDVFLNKIRNMGLVKKYILEDPNTKKQSTLTSVQFVTEPDYPIISNLSTEIFGISAAFYNFYSGSNFLSLFSGANEYELSGVPPLVNESKVMKVLKLNHGTYGIEAVSIGETFITRIQ